MIAPWPRFVILGVLLTACGEDPIQPEHYSVDLAHAAPVPEAPCRETNPLRNAYWGDLHVHTSISSDAWMFDVRVTPFEAYQYAFGEPIRLSPAGPDGQGSREVRIDRPLDFMAVTDHAEFMGEGRICLDEDAPGYDSSFCAAFRRGNGRAPRLLMRIFSPAPSRDDDVCGEDRARCRQATSVNWQRTIEAAEAWNDRSPACERTTFVAFEYSSHRMGSNLHRNVIFRNEVVPRLPLSYIEATREWELWEILRSGCIESSTGCDALAVPHNSNLSNARMFSVDYPGAETRKAQAARASLRIQLEPIIEIMQHKGDSECRNGVPGVLDSVDELCDFERFEDRAMRLDPGEEASECGEGAWADWRPHLGPDCTSRLNYARYALTEGLKEEERIGVNPFKFGLSASTDTHNGLGGGVAERSFPGHLGRGDDEVQKRVSFDRGNAGNAANNPGGIIGVWAEANDRGALFDAMRRKEVFGTSGPRIVPRFFAAWDLPEGLCDRGDRVSIADRNGVPMGGDLVDLPGLDGTPSFLSMALADAGTTTSPGTPLQRLQIIKGWVDDDGMSRQSIHEVAGRPDNGADVDLDTCQLSGSGFAELCSVWRDPDFDPKRRAVYYLRAVENPSCRYNAWQCIGLSGDERPADCDGPAETRRIQERAWSSPIWYTPPVEG